MLKEEFVISRTQRVNQIVADMAIVGGGTSGVCAAITAARQGIHVVLVQDRPVLGGNASSEVRLWILGATSHMGNNNRWAREGGVIDELLVENMYRNPESNSVIFDTILLEKVKNEPNITLLLNTTVFDVVKKDAQNIEKVIAFCSQNATQYEISATWFCDASGDGVVAFGAGAPFRMGAESRDEFGEKFAPDAAYGELLGHTIYFYSKDVGKPVKFIPPAYALKDITQIPRYRSFKAGDFGCRLWWIEYGGRKDTVYDTEEIKWKLWEVVYGVWNYIKNSGNFPEAENLTLEWVGNIPGKRESRRFEGEYMLTQQDVVEQNTFEDAVAFGGWSIDLHPADGVFSAMPGCNQWHSKGIYQIPFRSYYNKHISNLFFVGRLISVSHVAFGSTRVMATGSHGAQAVGMAVALAVKNNWNQQELTTPEHIAVLQQKLLETGQHIPGLTCKEQNKAATATITASSEYVFDGFPFDGKWIDLNYSVAQMLPVGNGKLPQAKLHVKAKTDTVLEVEMRISDKVFNYTPEIVLERFEIQLTKGEHYINLDSAKAVSDDRYLYLCLLKNDYISVQASNRRITGVLSLFNKFNKAVSNNGRQVPGGDIGVEEFEFWCPERRPAGWNLGLELKDPLPVFSAQNVINGQFRPTVRPNAWVADIDDTDPGLIFNWKSLQEINEVIIGFDTDYDHPMESSLMGHPESAMPFCVSDYKLMDHEGKIIYEKTNNYQTVNRIVFDNPIVTNRLIIAVSHPGKHIPAAIFQVIIK